ncbi:MAG: DNA alkylation repair protein [Clostridia bacterium]|nr:DNA alkylation repair protein [Clostridia bacterium]
MLELKRDNWTEEDYEEYVEELRAKSEEDYRKFHAGLAGEGNAELFGVRTPILRSMAKEIAKGNVKEFFLYCKERYYEEIVIEGMVIGNLKLRYEELCPLVDAYISKISSWAMNDLFCASLKEIKKDKDLWFSHIMRYLEAKNPWKIRCGLILMLDYFLEEKYIKEVLERTDKITNDFYYVKMAQAWLIATAFCKCRTETLKYLSNHHLSKWVLNKSIQKMRESYRISEEDKEYLVRLKM